MKRKQNFSILILNFKLENNIDKTLLIFHNNYFGKTLTAKLIYS